MGAQGINLCNTSHECHKRGSYRSSGAYQITILHRLPHQLLGNDIHNRKSVADNGVQLLVQTILYDSWQLLAIQLVCFIVTDLRQCLITVRNDRRTLVRSYRTHDIDSVGNLIGIGDHHFPCLVTAKVFKLLQHFLCCPKIQRRLVISIIKALSCHDDPPVDLILRIQEMDITGCHHRLVELFSKCYDSAVKVHDILFTVYCRNLGRINHKMIIAKRLDLQIVIKVHDPGNLLLCLAIQKRPVQLAGLTGTAKDKTLPVFQKKALWHPGMSVKILKMGSRNQPVQIFPPDIILCQDDRMITGQLFDDIRTGFPKGIDPGKSVRSPFSQHG